MVDPRETAFPPSPLRLALYEPDIPQNAGTLFRLGACLGVPVDLIEPAGFDASDRNLRRAGLDYLDRLDLTRHLSYGHFRQTIRARGHRLVLATTRGAVAHHRFAFRPGDIILLGRESAGVPDPVQEDADARIVIPMQPGLRSLNVAVSGAILVAEALRQLDGFASNDAQPDGKL
ncbi:tRNA (cytidine(34)-2'-O)-methyltransferase [Rhabdaerophilum sp. SD176]|uniref:tRNA (cytidine(34)-2'-O)-methyltransferase n=1 Tax=Rhabdaerophilum sp. SD176 TaxID=2983548 RepID=UPI0024DFABC9|nr:tRNA (cytidine(34)-2'-O)-methyltransferase [Rhabdaerophilum sp. SD176]